MSPEMLTLVAAVLVYDFAVEMRDARSSTVDTEASPRLLGAPESRSDMSWTRLENDMLFEVRGDFGRAWKGRCRERVGRQRVRKPVEFEGRRSRRNLADAGG
jgi:hypothetical protein